MMRVLFGGALLLVAFILGGCKEADPLYCHPNEPVGSSQHPLQRCSASEFCAADVTNSCEPVAGCLDGSYCAAHGNGAAFCALNVDERTAACVSACQTNEQCAVVQPGAAVCDVGSGLCVQCVGGDDCDSGLCDIDHTCVAASAVAYAAQNGTGAACTQEVPCSLSTAIAAVSSTVRYIKLAPSTGPGHYDGHFVLSGLTVTIVGDLDAQAQPLAAITSETNSDEPLLKIVGANTNVVVVGVRIFGAIASTNALARNVVCSASGSVTFVDSDISNSEGASIETLAGECALSLNKVTVTDNGGAGIVASGGAALSQVTVTDNGGAGIVASGGAALTLSRSMIARNHGGGVDINGAFDVTNNIIAYNGSDVAGFGGVRIDAPGSIATRVFNHNTIVKNQADFAASGLICNVSSTTMILNNIVALNEMDGGGVQASFAGGCSADTTASNSSVGANPVVVANIPFVSVGNSINFDFHLASALPAQGKVGSGVTTDIDGDARDPGAPDIGADERP